MPVPEAPSARYSSCFRAVSGKCEVFFARVQITNPEPVLLRTRELLIYQQKDFWTANWSLTGKDNSAGRRSVVDALVQIGRNKRAGREWSEDVELLESEPE